MLYNGLTPSWEVDITFFWLYNSFDCYIPYDITVLYNEGVI